MYQIRLAKRLNSLSAEAGVHIRESDLHVIASNLTAVVALEIIDDCSQLGWPFSAFDEAGTATEPEEISNDFEPFRISLRKPDAVEGILDILTESGFVEFLDKGHKALLWRVVLMPTPLVTLGRVIGNWSETQTVREITATKSPRDLVRESGNTRRVPEEILPWLLDEKPLNFNERLHLVWATKAFDALVNSIAEEIGAEDHALVFKGPPKLRLSTEPIGTEELKNLGADFFAELQSAAHWVYQNKQEAELKHRLLSTEIARSGRQDGNVAPYLKDHLSAALESAKIAYQMSVSDLAKDTLKSLGELRKAITEDTAKATDATKQTVTAVSGAIAVGIGLVAARLNSAIDPVIISAVMLAAVGYIAMIVYSGWGFICLQRDLRKEWQPKLYRYLPTDDYKKMVTIPAEKTERVFKISAIIGLASVTLLFLGIAIFSFSAHTNDNLQQSQSGSQKLDNTTGHSQVTLNLKSHIEKSLPDNKAWISPLARSVNSNPKDQ